MALTKTGVNLGTVSLSAHLKLTNQDRYVFAGPWNFWPATWDIQVGYGATALIRCIHDGTGTPVWDGPDQQPDYPPGTKLTFVKQLYISQPGGYADEAHEFVYWGGAPGDGFDIEDTFAATATGLTLWRDETLTPGEGRESAPVLSSDRAFADEWVTDPTAHLTATFGDLSVEADGTGPGLGFGCTFYQHVCTPASKTLFGQLSGVSWTGNSHDLACYEWPHPEDDSTLYFDGVTGGVNFYARPLVADESHSVTVYWPLMRDYSRFYIRDREGNVDNDLGIQAFQCDLRYPWSMDLDHAVPLAEGAELVPGTSIAVRQGTVRTLAPWVQSAGTVSGMNYREPDYEHGLIETNALYFTKWSRAS